MDLSTAGNNIYGTARTTLNMQKPPEVPKAPPVSYRPHPNPAQYDRSSNTYPASFAERAAALTGKPLPTAFTDLQTIPEPPSAKPTRRGSLNRPIGGVYSEIQQHRRDSAVSPNNPVSPRRFSNPSILPQQQNSDTSHPGNTEQSPPHIESQNSIAGPPISSRPGGASSGTAPSASTEYAWDRSPLQKLEVKLTERSKEEKRARVQQAEKRLRDSKGTVSIQDPTQQWKSATNSPRSPSDLKSSGSTGRSPDSLDKQYIQKPAVVAQYPSFDTYSLETSQTPLDRRRASLPENFNRSKQTSKARKPRAVSGFPVFSEEFSTKTPKTARRQPEVERGVRFESGRHTVSSDSHAALSTEEDPRSRRRSSVAEAVYTSDGAPMPKRDDLRQDSPNIARKSAMREMSLQQKALHSDQAQRNRADASAATDRGDPDPVTRHVVKSHDHVSNYEIPGQTASGIQARRVLGFGGEPYDSAQAPIHRKHHLPSLLHRTRDRKNVPLEQSDVQTKYLDEWRRAGTARLTSSDFADNQDTEKGEKTWWERKTANRHRSEKSRGLNIDLENQDAAPATDMFKPALYLKSGPLLRYTGMRTDRLESANEKGGFSSLTRETWRGSVMIVTADADSCYNPAPSLHLFPEPMDLVPPPVTNRIDPGVIQDLPSEVVDPIAGLPKLSRSGKTVYVKPVDDLDPGKDLSQVEDDDGLFEETRTAAVPTAYGTPDFNPQQASLGNPRPPRRRNKLSRKGQVVKGFRLHTERGVTFWRFNLEVELGPKEIRVAYSINGCPAIGFWVPARGESMNIAFHSCNGFSMSVDPNNFSGPDPLWRDVLNSHQSRPFHVIIGGGDQIYNDAVMNQSPQLQEWLHIKDPHSKRSAEFTSSLKDELETFYLERYSMWFSQGLFGMANSQIPMVNMWDDHDIIDGFGSYPHYFMSSPVFCGLGAVAFKYYMLFQHQSVPLEGSEDEPSWLLGAAPGPYINELSRSLFVSLGKNLALLALDCRTERMREEILSEASYEMIFDRCRRELIDGETKHLIVLLGVPIAYPRLVWLENLLTSRVMDPVKALGRAGILGGFLNKFDGGVEILDDLDDHWTAKNHKQERNWFIQELQELAAEKSIRVTILGGDVHLAAVGQFFSNPKLRTRKDRDHRYMVNVISSAIVNTPPPSNMADILNKRNKTHHLDEDTCENMIPMFTHDVNGSPRNNKHLLPRRNWCSIREYHPGSTPLPTPPDSDTEPEFEDDASPSPPRTPLQRTLSLTRGDIRPSNIIRRFSGRALVDDSAKHSPPDGPHNEAYFPRIGSWPQGASIVGDGRRNSSTPLPNSSAPLPRPGNFHRRPTNVSERAAKKGDVDDLASHINLEHGLDIVLNCEVDQKNPAGITNPYRLLIPALFYEGESDLNTEPYRKKSIFSRFGSIRSSRRNQFTADKGLSEGDVEESRTPSDFSEDDDSYEPVRPRRWSFGISQRRQYRDQTPPNEREHGFEKRVGEFGTQQQRVNEHRSQQIGSRKLEAYSKQARKEEAFNSSEESVIQEQRDPFNHRNHGESLSPVAGMDYADRRADHVLSDSGIPGISRVKRNQERRAFRKFQDNRATNINDIEVTGSSDEDIDPDQKRMSQGYGGIEAYSESNVRGWKKLLGNRLSRKLG